MEPITDGARMMRKAMAGWLAAGLLLLGGCTQDRPASTPAPVASGPALWAVKDADTTIYLFGTVHVMTPGVTWFDGKVKRAFEKSDELVLEIIEPDDPNALAGLMGSKALAADGTKLSDRLTPEQKAKYQAAMTANGLPWPAFEGFNPWMPGMALSVAPLERLGYKTELGAEKVLTTQARTLGKKVSALETVEQQINFFATLPMAQQLAFLNSTVDGLPDVEKEFASLIVHWKAGEPDALAAEMNESLKATPELAQVLLYNRNANWAKWIKARLDQPGTVFVAVGAGHLAGAGSVQDQLKAIGLEAARVEK
jgi:uncharacterized protein YbaP (TraB family)